MPISPFLLEILCYPAADGGAACHGELLELEAGLKCKKCGLVYPMEDGILVLLADHAKKDGGP
jgi:uncharacterized protein YbaR (Trm112 family)